LRSTTENKVDVLKDSLSTLPPQTTTAFVDRNNVATATKASNVPTASSKPPAVPVDQSTRELARKHMQKYISSFVGQNGASIIYTKLQENNVSVVNGFSGGAVLPLLDQFHEGHPRHALPGAPPPIRWITNSNESSAGHIAEGYAKSVPFDPENLPVGVVVATSGPGVTNLITPLQDAICDGVPIVVLCGQAATVAPPDAFQSAPAVELTKPCTKWSYQIKSAAELPIVMDYAFYVAKNGRPGPVYIDLPKDLQNQVLTQELVDSFIQTNLSDNADPRNSLIRFEESKEGNRKTQVYNIGYGYQGLPFQFVERNVALELSVLEKTSNENIFHNDHRPTNQVYYTMPGKKDAVVADFASNQKTVQEMIKRITSAKKPVIIAGQGCNDAAPELMEFAKKLQIPVATTLHALGCFDERDELALNMMGMHGHPTPNFMVQESDLIICIGSRFDDRITGRMSSFVPQARMAAEEGRGGIIHVDIRLTEMAKQVQPTFFVHSTGKNFLQTMNKFLSEKDYKPMTGPWLENMRKLQKDFPVKIPHFPTEEIQVVDEKGVEFTVHRTPMSAQSVVHKMDEMLVASNVIDDTIITTGVGIHQMVAAQLITWTQPRQMLSSGSLGTMGVSLGYSIGAKLANGQKIVISVDGDGSFNMTFTELKTLAEHKIPVKILLLDNDGQMMVEYWQRLFHDNRLIAVRNSHNPHYTTLAKAFGIKSIYCDCEEDLEAKMKEFLFDDPDEPVLFHARIERTPCLPMVAPGQPLEDMILEDVEVDVEGSAAPS
jgi:acetolactate synthase-1/2/3 large subunit